LLFLLIHSFFLMLFTQNKEWHKKIFGGGNYKSLKLYRFFFRDYHLLQCLRIQYVIVVVRPRTNSDPAQKSLTSLFVL
jgi:hypothetical protein